jgi:hypothetical protein
MAVVFSLPALDRDYCSKNFRWEFVDCFYTHLDSYGIQLA